MAKIIMIGTGTAVVKESRHAASFLLEISGQKILFDCGWGTGENLVKSNINPADIDHILISHPHADHLGNLIPLLQSIHVSGVYFEQTKRIKPLYLHGYPGFKNDYQKLREVMVPEMKEDYPIEVTDYHNEKREWGEISITSHLVNHVPKHFPATAFKVTSSGKSVVNSGDLGYDEALAYLAKGADVLVVEMCIHPKTYSQNGPRSNHLSPYEDGLLASKAKVKKLVLTHLYDNITDIEALSEIRKVFKGEVVLPNDLEVIDL